MTVEAVGVSDRSEEERTRRHSQSSMLTCPGSSNVKYRYFNTSANQKLSISSILVLVMLLTSSIPVYPTVACGRKVSQRKMEGEGARVVKQKEGPEGTSQKTYRKILLKARNSLLGTIEILHVASNPPRIEV
jgi:hypothetical protein